MTDVIRIGETITHDDLVRLIRERDQAIRLTEEQAIEIAALGRDNAELIERVQTLETGIWGKSFSIA
jgi:hypothetical protein